MREIFNCTNLSFDGKGYRYINNKEQLLKVKSKNIQLRCYVDDFFLAVSEFSCVKDKKLVYHVIIAEDVGFDNYDNIFDTLVDLEKYRSIIFKLELRLLSKISSDNFAKLLHFIKSGNEKIEINFDIEYLNLISGEQLLELKKSNINSNIELSRSLYEAYVLGYDYNNVFTIDSLLEVKKEMKKIVDAALQQKNDIAKILFIYTYLGKRIKYDYKACNDNASNALSKEFQENIIYNVLIKKKGICSGIAGIFKILMEEIGIDCQVVNSSDHAWNVVKIDGVWYHLDLTFDLKNIKNHKLLQFFLKGESAIAKDDSHQIDMHCCDELEIAQRSVSKRLYIK